MDPLRCGAGEAGAFHPLYKALQNNTSKNGLRQRFLCAVLDGEAVCAAPFFQSMGRVERTPAIFGRAGVELALWAR